ncbi:protein PRR14L isoform X3 [Erythrolamprus reginae]|uniref:protein PRR14L isoform X3 n=1 Tax=Erythrolamprus reginae TaxID=121349 RepID=UPI00396C6FAA
MSSAGWEFHAASADPREAPGPAGGRPSLALPREPHGRRSLRASRPEMLQPQEPEMRGGLKRPGWCEGGPGGGNARPGEKAFQLNQKGRKRVSSPSCLEIKDLPQNLESPAKVRVASEKQPGLPREAPGMKADGPGQYSHPAGEPRAQARTGALLKASQCSGGAAASGDGSFVSQEPLGPASSKEEEEEPPTCARPTGEKRFQMDAVSNSRPSVQQEMFETPLHACPPGTSLETTGQTFQGSPAWGERMHLSGAACKGPEGSFFKSGPSSGRMEDLGEASELQGPEAPTVPKDRPSENGCSPLCDVVQAASGGEPRGSPSEAGSIQQNGSSPFRHEKCITLGKGNGALLLKRNSFVFLQNSCSIEYVSVLLSRLPPQLDLGGDGFPLRVEPEGTLRTALLLCDLAQPLRAARSIRVPEVSVSAGEKSLLVPPLHGPSPFAQKADPGSGRRGPILYSLSPEGVIVMRRTEAWLHHKTAFAPRQDSGKLQAGMNEGAWEMVRWGLRGAESGEVAMEPFWRKILCFSDQTLSDLSSAPEEIYALARNLFLDCKHLPKGRRRAATEISLSLGISPALSESSGRFSLQFLFSCSPYRKNWVGLDGARSPLDCVYPLEVPGSHLSRAEAENWSVDGRDAFDGSESILERKSNLFLPSCERVEVHKASFGADAGGMKTIENAPVRNNTRLFLQLAFDGDLSKTFPLCRATFRKGQCLEEQKKYQIHPPSPACNLSYLNKKDSCLCTKRLTQQTEPVYQMNIFLYPCYFLDGCTLFEQKNNSPKTEFLKHQRPSLIFCKKLSHHDLQTVISLAVKYVRCNKNESLHSKMELKATPPATAVLTEYHQGLFQEIIIESSNNNNQRSEFAGHLLNKDFLESQNRRTLFGCSESTSESLSGNDFVKNRTQSKTDNLHSASESVHKSLSEKFSFKNGLLSASKLALSPFQTGATTSAQIKGQERMKGLLLKSYRKRKRPSLVSAGLGCQNKKMCFFPKDAVSMSPSLKAHGSPLAQRPRRGTLLLGRGADGGSWPFGLGRERVSSSPRAVAAAAGPLTSKGTHQRFRGPGIEATVSLAPLGQPLGAAQGLEAVLREPGRTAGMTAEGFPLRILSDTEALLEMLPSGGGMFTFSFKALTHGALPLGSPEDISEHGSIKAKGCPGHTVMWWHLESLRWVLQTKLFLSSRKLTEALGSSLASSSGLEEGRLASFPMWPWIKGGHLLRVESRRELAGAPEKGLEGPLVDERLGRRDSGVGAQLPAPKEKAQGGRRLATGQPPGNPSEEKAEGPGDPAGGTLAFLGRAGQKRRQKEPPFHGLSGSKRPKRTQRGGETASLNLCVRNRWGQANRWPSSMGAFGGLDRAAGCNQSGSPDIFGYLPLQSPFPAFGKVSETACIKAGMLRWLRAPKPLTSEGPPEMLPGEKGDLVYSVPLATQPAAPPALLWDPTAKQQGPQSSLPAVSWLSGQPKNACLLTRVSWLAEELLGPTCQPFPPRGGLLPSAAKWGPLRRRRRQRRLEVFSFVSLKLDSPLRHSSNSGSFKMPGSQAPPFCSVESAVLCFFEMNSNGHSPPVPPGYLHHHMDAGPAGKLPKTGPLSPVSRWALGSPLPQLPSAQSLSCLPPPRCPDIRPVQKDAKPGYTLTPKEGEAVAHRMGCLAPGLPTALALFSPGCYRAWTRRKRRRRRPSSGIPAVQRPSLLQLAQGLKGIQCGTSVSADLFSYLLGSVLSVWSQRGPSSPFCKPTPLHSSPSKGEAALPAMASLSHRSRLSLPPLVPSLPSDIPPGAVKNDTRLESILSVLLPTSCQAPEPARPPLSFPALGSGDGKEASVPASPKTGAPREKDASENRPKKVSLIRIRKTIPKPDPNLTPMGLPRPKRLKKTEFSLEEIYTNQNYKSPPATRCLETIFEEPKEKNGSLISVSQQKRKRILEFQDFTIPRKRRARSRVRVTGGYTRAKKAALEGRELDVLLIQKLTDLETFFAKEETQEQAALCS